MWNLADLFKIFENKNFFEVREFLKKLNQLQKTFFQIKKKNFFAEKETMSRMECWILSSQLLNSLAMLLSFLSDYAIRRKSIFIGRFSENKKAKNRFVKRAKNESAQRNNKQNFRIPFLGRERVGTMGSRTMALFMMTLFINSCVFTMVTIAEQRMYDESFLWCNAICLVSFTVFFFVSCNNSFHC